MDPELQAFEEARSDRAKRTDYDGHVTRTMKTPRGAVEVVDMKASTHRERTQHEGTAADMARAYVASHPELEARYAGLGIPDLVAMVDACRATGNEERRIEIDVWLMAKFAPQVISGVHTGTEADY